MKGLHLRNTLLIEIYGTTSNVLTAIWLHAKNYKLKNNDARFDLHFSFLLCKIYQMEKILKMQLLIIFWLLLALAFSMKATAEQATLFDCWVIRTKQNILTDNSTKERARLESKAKRLDCQAISEQEILENF